MMAKNHLLVTSAIVVAAFKFKYLNFGTYYQFYIFYFSALLGCLLPDIDEKESYIGKKLLILSFWISMFLRHKTFTHYLFLPILIFILGYYYATDKSQIVMFGIAFGIFLHSLEDMLTNRGIKGYLFPFFPNTYIALLPNILRLETGGIIESLWSYLIFFPLNAYLIYKVLVP